jgi:hypothetical protein
MHPKTVLQLLRKPGAFERYRYREQLFPNRSFREAYDHLVAKHGQRGGAVEYLRLLKLASEVGESDIEVMLADYDPDLSSLQHGAEREGSRKTKPFESRSRRYRPPDQLLSFLQSL